MFPARFFPDRYFAPRYWPKVGLTANALAFLGRNLTREQYEAGAVEQYRPLAREQYEPAPVEQA